MENLKQRFIEKAYSKFGIKADENINFEQAFEILDEIDQCNTQHTMVANTDGCPNCLKKEYHQHRNPQNNNKVRKCLWCKTVWEIAT